MPEPDNRTARQKADAKQEGFQNKRREALIKEWEAYHSAIVAEDTRRPRDYATIVAALLVVAERLGGSR